MKRNQRGRKNASDLGLGKYLEKDESTPDSRRWVKKIQTGVEKKRDKHGILALTTVSLKEGNNRERGHKQDIKLKPPQKTRGRGSGLRSVKFRVIIRRAYSRQGRS